MKGRLSLEKERGSEEFIIAAKFLMKRALNTEAIVRNFNPLWWSRNGFKVRNAGDHVILFIFDNNEEVDKILLSEPWSFDKYLVILQRYEIDTLIHYPVFDKVSLWVQVHDILVRYLNRGVVVDLCDVVGEVD